jgi:hypothetical protein
MADASFDGPMYGLLARLKIDGAKLGGLTRIRMRHANQVHEGIGWGDLRCIAFRAQRVARNHLATKGQLRLGTRPYQSAHAMSASQQFPRQTASHEPRSAR